MVRELSQAQDSQAAQATQAPAVPEPSARPVQIVAVSELCVRRLIEDFNSVMLQRFGPEGSGVTDEFVEKATAYTDRLGRLLFTLSTLVFPVNDPEAAKRAVIQRIMVLLSQLETMARAEEEECTSLAYRVERMLRRMERPGLDELSRLHEACSSAAENVDAWLIAAYANIMRVQSAALLNLPISSQSALIPPYCGYERVT